MLVIEDLKREIEERKKQLAYLESQAELEEEMRAIKSLGEFTVEEKVEIFDRLYNSAYSVVSEVKKNGYREEDTPHHLYEQMMSIVARDHETFWKYYNSLSN
jgi:hypothetical protein